MAALQEEIRTRREAVVRTPLVDERNRQSQQERGAKKQAWFNRISLAFCCLASFGAVWMVAAKGAQIYEINQNNVQLQTQIQQQQAVNAMLKTQVAQLEQPSHILNVAINQLHMQYKNPIVIPSGQTGQ
ncbi:cell division protein FtsL [Alicyclobacillus sacchari]|uniref:Cell division protein FtsL n=1 Tax=Alicyclobacillus sacchari TaxID=392010 RepID=A0A4R8LMV3_9BACL|nr:septum formation initiator family protein [Alicyclobacillus sacchari]TDY46670.1 cell division protein FtsL [Alicyclobacillus sacchari]